MCREYLRYNQIVTIFEVATATRIPLKILRKMIEDFQLEEVRNDQESGRPSDHRGEC